VVLQVPPFQPGSVLDQGVRVVVVGGVGDVAELEWLVLLQGGKGRGGGGACGLACYSSGHESMCGSLTPYHGHSTTYLFTCAAATQVIALQAAGAQHGGMSCIPTIPHSCWKGRMAAVIHLHAAP
jgi:hypothetical protein